MDRKMKRMQTTGALERRAFLLGWAALVPVASLACARPKPKGARLPAKLREIHLVRHAEKRVDAEDPDPALSEAGHGRARALVEATTHLELDGLYCSQFKRTRQTLEPTAVARSLPIAQYDAGDPSDLFAKIDAAGHARVLVAGHSNTVPELLARLGVKEAVVLEESDYGDLFSVTLAEDGAVGFARGRFGA